MQLELQPNNLNQYACLYDSKMLIWDGKERISMQWHSMKSDKQRNNEKWQLTHNDLYFFNKTIKVAYNRSYPLSLTKVTAI